MMDKIKKILPKNIFPGKKDKDYTFYPGKDWKKMFFSFVVLNLIFVGLLIYFYIDMERDDIRAFESLESENELILNTEFLEEISDHYREKKDFWQSSFAEEFENLENLDTVEEEKEEGAEESEE